MTDTLYTITDLEKRYGQRTVLRVPHLHIHDAEIVALVGPSGAGKSTLLRLLALLEPTTDGTLNLNLDGKPYSHTDATIDIRRHIAMVFQRPLLLSRSVRHNIAYGLKIRGMNDIDARVDDALDKVSLTHLANAKPHTLSGGEMQRVSIARAMVLQPRVLLLDEPTANLDPQNIRIIESFLLDQHTRFGTTIVIVTHNIFQARRLAHRVGLIYDGALVEISETETFFTNPQDERTAAFTNGDLIY